MPDIIKFAVPWIIYVLMFLVAIYGTLRQAQWSFLLLVVLIPLPALWYPTHALPLGKDMTDILIGSSLLGAIINKDGFESPKGSMIVWLFAGVSFCSLLNMLMRFGLGLDAGFGVIADWKNYVEIMLLYFLAYSILKNEAHQKLLLTIIGFVMLFIAVQAFRSFSERSTFSYDKRASGPFELLGLGANHFAAFVAHFSSLLLGLLLVDTHRGRRWLFVAAVLFCLHPLFFAYSRGAYAAMLAVLAIYGLLRYRSILVFLVVLAFTWQVMLPDTVVERITMTTTDDGQLEESAALRVALWERAEQMFRDNPLFGVGFNGFAYAMRGEPLTNTHNFFIQTAAEQGLIGLTMLALLFARCYWVAWNVYRRGASEFHRGLGLGFIGCVTAVIITNTFGDRFSPFAIGGYFFIVFGVLERAWVSCRNHQPPAPSVELGASAHSVI